MIKSTKNRNFTCKRVRENEEDKWSAQFEGKLKSRRVLKLTCKGVVSLINDD